MERNMNQTVTLNKVEQKLRHASRKHARLYLFCNFTALMIISAYSGLMFSPTIQTAFPSGGDSRKQMNVIFILTLIGCVIFTIYAASLFFRHKSKQLGILMALGASRKRLAPTLFREILLLSSLSSISGIIAGFPFIWIVWNLFRLLLIDSTDMQLDFDFKCLPVSLLFFTLVLAFTCFIAWRYLHKTNIMEVIREEHINEPVRELGKWCAPAGCLLLAAGVLMGYWGPSLYCDLANVMLPPAWMNLLYAPAFAGLYMIMLHAVVHGFRAYRKQPYKNILSRSMMKFQGKQTVNNMIVVALLIAGSCFGIFYIPVTAVGSMMKYAAQPYDYFYCYRADQSIPDESAVRMLAQKHGLRIKDWEQFEYITLGYGGITSVMEEDGIHFHEEYERILSESKTLSEDTWRALSGKDTTVRSGTYLCITNQEQTSYSVSPYAEHITNMVSRDQIATKYAGIAVSDFSSLTNTPGCRILNQKDYNRLAEGLTDDWKGFIIRFNIDGKDSYAFADELYRLLVSSTDDTCMVTHYYDRVNKTITNEKGEDWWGDQPSEAPFMRVNPKQIDSIAFRMGWMYHPDFRILNQNDFLLSTSVLLMMFLFIFIVCLMTALVICYTRCQTIALNNRYIFDDLRKLGASPDFLAKEVRSQCRSVFRTPSLVGMTIIYLIFILLLYGNDWQLVLTELIALCVCLGILGIIGVCIYLIYRLTVKSIIKKLEIR